MNTATARRLVTDAPIRVFHALFATGFAVAWLTGDADDWRALHVALGYGLAGLLGWRLLYGWLGPRQARLGMMWRRAAGLLPWLQALPGRLGGDGAPRAGYWQQGQTLLMAVLPLLLMAGLPFLALSGLASYQDWDGLGEASEELHEVLANALGAVALLHPGLVLLGSLLRGRNLAAAMGSGRIAGPGPDLVQRERRAWGLLLAVAVVIGTGMLWRNEQLHPTAASGASAMRHADADDDDD